MKESDKVLLPSPVILRDTATQLWGRLTEHGTEASSLSFSKTYDLHFGHQNSEVAFLGDRVPPLQKSR